MRPHLVSGLTFARTKVPDNLPQLAERGVPLPNKVLLVAEWSVENALKVGVVAVVPSALQTFKRRKLAEVQKERLYLVAVAVQPHPPYEDWPAA